MTGLSVPSDLLYASTHEWCDRQGDVVTVGITDYAQDQLSDVVFVELPEVGEDFETGQTMATVESVKAAADVYAPVAGRVTAVNGALLDSPEEINTDPYGSWFLRLEVAPGTGNPELLNAAGYRDLTET